MSRLTSVVSVVGMSLSSFIGGQSRRSYVRRWPLPSTRRLYFLFLRRFSEVSLPCATREPEKRRSCSLTPAELEGQIDERFYHGFCSAVGAPSKSDIPCGFGY